MSGDLLGGGLPSGRVSLNTELPPPEALGWQRPEAGICASTTPSPVPGARLDSFQGRGDEMPELEAKRLRGGKATYGF